MQLYLKQAGGNLLIAVGYYHSHDPDHKQTYLRSVLQQVLRLRSRQPADLRVVAQQVTPLLPHQPAASPTAPAPGG